jgi:predicted nucleic acid-binding Zn ribbon protein
MGAGAGVIFKGTGFYLTDYKKISASPSKKEEKPPPSPSSEKK